MKRPLLFLCALLPTTALARAGTVIYTDTAHLPDLLPLDIQVILLDGPERMQARIFGQLPADPEQASALVRQVMAAPDWQQQQRQLAASYRQVVHAWELGIKKFPAVVFDDRDVVYGTTDVDLAAALRQQAGGDQ